jgi:ABC-type microcin C transport system duplicated ATPase subunit YejF
MPEALLSVEDLEVHFPVRGGVLQRQTATVKAVDGVSFSLGKGETLSLVGESGCGKSTTGLALMGLVKPTGGRVRFDGQEIRSFDRRALKDYRRRMQIVFQDPFSSLNPRHRVREAIRAPLDIHGIGTPAERDAAKSPNSWRAWVCGLTRPTIFRTSSRAGSGSASALRAPWP